MEMNRNKRNWTIAALLLSIFLSSLDQTIVSTALPSIVQKIGGLDVVSWVFTIYMLASTAIMPVVGKLSDMYGRKRFYIAGLALFTGGSLLCGLATSMTQLIVFRGIQGLGAGFLMPITFTLIFTIIPQERAGKFQALFMGVYALSSVVGPTIGSVITEQLNWHWNFFVNIPFGIAAILIMCWSLVESRADTGKPKVDYAGALLLIVTTVILLLAFKLAGEDYAWGSWEVLLMLLSGALALVLFIGIELRASEAIIPLHLFRNRTIAGVSLASFVQGMIMYGALLYIPFFIQAGLGGNVKDAGNALTPMMFSVMVGTVLGTMLMKRLSWRGSVLLASSLMGMSAFLFTTLPLDVNMWYVRGNTALIGVGIGILMPNAQTAATLTAPERYRGVATSMVTFFRTIGGVLGVSIMAAIVNQHLATEIQRQASVLQLDSAVLDKLSNAQMLIGSTSLLPDHVAAALRASLVASIHSGFWLLVIAAALVLPMGVLMGNERFHASNAVQSKHSDHLDHSSE